MTAIKDGEVGLTERGILSRPDGATISYSRLEGKNPGVVFLHGYRSDMSGGKALALEDLCRARGQAFLRFDAFGHGGSSGDLLDGTIGRWAADAVAVIEALAPGPQILVGSSLGGWIATLAALELRARVVGLVGIAAALDFTEDLVWADLDVEQRRTLLETGEIALGDDNNGAEPHWRFRRSLIDDGRNHLLLRDFINLYCPVRLIHGQRDSDVPWRTSLHFAEMLASDAVEVCLVKDGDHRLSRPEDLERLSRTVEDLIV
ncbi:alpha/beta hydrolase [Magnetospirillum molischianum]|uniref:Palmitoyl-protein thioesterase ABHD10, mitochondrial n=1 Tax=Magnetospirillum molischianum DSM 120 TaxID=1150626 RepID=H8FN48_MAGML|nr:alpha/beta hydrolase [Magnetospirillum molischianum]CCG39786.1 Abhydrolase domain-containing protein 10, mitochondrial [Magnetospirillum molischianum DSM 120]